MPSSAVARLLAGLVVVYLVLYVVAHYTPNLDRLYPPPTPTAASTHQLFPPPHFRSFQTPFRVLQVVAEQKNVPTLALLVQTVRKHRHQLWSLLPYAVSPPPVKVYEADRPFGWAVNDDSNLLVIADARRISLWRKSELSRATLGSWKMKQHWTLDYGHDDDPAPRVSLTRQGSAAVLTTARGLLALFRLDEDTFYLQPMSVDTFKIDFQLYPRSVLAEHNLLVTAVPDFRQTDGVVDVYHFPHRELDLFNVELLQTIVPPLRGGYFGGQVITAQLNRAPLIVISAPFAHQGAGSLYLYSRTSTDGMFQCGQTIQGTGPVEQLGRVVALSENAQFLAVSTQTSVCLLEFQPRAQVYQHIKVFPGTPSDLQALHVDNAGNVIYATSTSVRIPLHVAHLPRK